ncbi:hypothetical protein EVC45_42140 [Paraburkholderia sp. UYCP14C]|uniref:hypothetical protein n=1 Tax=Paraburkholderia sp. UYCP14C TaxID=2511130 RepID=UPI0010215994|nr:hypothetical protein [Paraburkholderia sp. UYCP14C]RZF23819.1 hypothetical protein EVC45_42140 [Paraburkholderia sp. UYCP14C]
MLAESEPIALEYFRELELWTCAWYEEAIAANHVRPPYHPDATIIERIRGYFRAGLSPAEAADACFGMVH